MTSQSGCNSVVECQLPKLDVAGSTPVARSNISSRYSNDLTRSQENSRDDASAPSPTHEHAHFSDLNHRHDH